MGVRRRPNLSQLHSVSNKPKVLFLLVTGSHFDGPMLRLHLKRAVLVLPRRRPLVLLVVGDVPVDERFPHIRLMKLALEQGAVFLGIFQVFGPV